MPQGKTPVERRRKDVGRPPSRGTLTQSSPPLVAPATERRNVVVVGSAQDVPRALEHTAVAAGRFEVVAVLAIDVEAGDQRGAIRRLAALLRAHRAETILVAGPGGARTIPRAAGLALVHNCELPAA